VEGGARSESHFSRHYSNGPCNTLFNTTPTQRDKGIERWFASLPSRFSNPKGLKQLASCDCTGNITTQAHSLALIEPRWRAAGTARKKKLSGGPCRSRAFSSFFFSGVPPLATVGLARTKMGDHGPVNTRCSCHAPFLGASIRGVDTVACRYRCRRGN
jgi:hypothetical protein